MENIINSKEYKETRAKVEAELSAKHPLNCFCGRLATGLHESMCQKFKKAVDKKTLSLLKKV